MQNSGPEVVHGQSASSPEDTQATKLAQQSEELAHPDAVRRAVALSATELLRSLDPDHSIPRVLELIGSAAGVSRIQLYENERRPDGRLNTTRRYEWAAPGVTSADQIEQRLSLDTSAWDPYRLLPFLAKGEPCSLLTRNADEPFRGLLETFGIRSVLLVPVFVDNQWWGQMGFDDCESERAWAPLEIDTLETLAELVGTAMARARDVRELSDASRIIENSPAVLYRLDAQKPHSLVYVSRNVSRYGYSADELLSSPTRYLDLLHPDDLSGVIVDLATIAAGRTTEASRERRIRASDGRYVWVEDRTRALYGEHHRLTAIEGVLIDINDRKVAEEQIARFALTDPLTGLANRQAFMEELERAYVAAERGATPFAILYLDLDHFKDVNDVLGHSKGDEVLTLVAKRLKNVRRSSDLIARFGGDEFGILQSDVSDPSDAGMLAARVLQDLAAPYDIGTQIGLTASIGIAVFTHDVSGPEEMVKQADMALYRAKDLGRNQYHFHSERLGIAIIEHVTLAGDLHQALDHDELELFYQPQVDARSGKIIGLEALMRWHHPTRGLLGPGLFIPIAEKTGTILQLGHWVIDEVCRQIATWRAERLLPPTVAINVSAVQLKSLPEFDHELSQRLNNWNLEPRAIELELTESVLMETTQKHGEIIDRLRALGVLIAIDDFGTGYSSLGYLRAYRVNHIKIAQEFIHNLQPHSGDIAIVRAAISLARELGIAVIAEGVETAFQLELLTAAGCQYIQGFYFSRPLPPTQVPELLLRGTVDPAPLTPDAANQAGAQRTPPAPPG